MSGHVATMAMTSPRQKPRTTLINVGAFLPRPGGAPTSPRLQSRDAQAPSSNRQNAKAPRGAINAESAANFLGSMANLFDGARSPRGTSGGGFFDGALSPRSRGQPTGLKKALATRGGVAREKDGFEVFYGVEAKEVKQSRRISHDLNAGRDGFDKFYGISKARAATYPSAQTNLGEGSGSRGLKDESRQQEAQLTVRLGVQSPKLSPRLMAGEVLNTSEVVAPQRKDGADVVCLSARGRTSTQVPAGVQVFSLSEDVVFPNNVPTYSLCGPSQEMPPHPELKTAGVTCAMHGSNATKTFVPPLRIPNSTKPH